MLIRGSISLMCMRRLALSSARTAACWVFSMSAPVHIQGSRNVSKQSGQIRVDSDVRSRCISQHMLVLGLSRVFCEAPPICYATVPLFLARDDEGLLGSARPTTRNTQPHIHTSGYGCCLIQLASGMAGLV